MTAALRPRQVAIVATSGFVEAELIHRAAAYFIQRDWQVQLGDSCFARFERFAGPDELRVRELRQFCTAPDIDLVLSARGGYGLTRLLNQINFPAIRAATPRFICGYSDFTAFNLAYLACAAGISWHGPAATDFGAQEPDPQTLSTLFDVLEHAHYATRFDADGPNTNVSGCLWGGNLAMVCALLGTPYFPSVTGGILFLEDVNEPAYKIERMLLQLEQAGVLARQSALLLGQFAPVTPMPNDNGFSLNTVINGLRQRLSIPIITGLPFGHVKRKLTLPVGLTVQLTVSANNAELTWRR